MGGLTIWKGREVNVSLLGKLIWALFHEPYKLWVQVLMLAPMLYRNHSMVVNQNEYKGFNEYQIKV